MPDFFCEQVVEHESPIGAGVESVHVERATGNVPSLLAAYNRGSGWFDDSFAPFEPGDKYKGPFPIQDPSKFEAIPGKTFWLKFYGTWSDNGAPKAFTIAKQCTAKKTAIFYRNAYDEYPNVIITITWNKEYPGS